MAHPGGARAHLCDADGAEIGVSGGQDQRERRGRSRVDISRAIGENAGIPAELAEPLLEIDKELVNENLRGRVFAGEVKIAGGTASDRLVAFFGRTP